MGIFIIADDTSNIKVVLWDTNHISLIENGKILQHFLLHICELEPKTTEILNNSEGRLDWFHLNYLSSFKEKIIPSDFLIIEKIIKNKEKKYYNCIIEKKGNFYLLKKFE